MRRNLTLSELCDYLTSGHYELLPENHPMGMRLVCPEYSRSAQEVTSYPFLSRDRIFAICWRFDEAQNLYATMYPSLNPFIYHRPSGGCMQTQLHTHDYMELGYVVRGEFHQKILGKDTIFTEGDLFLIDRNCIHQDSLTALSTVILFLGIAGDMFTEIMNNSRTTQKIVSFLQSALLKQKDLQQYLHFRPNTGRSKLENCLADLLTELAENTPGTQFIRKGLLIRCFHIISTEYDFTLSKEQRKTMNWFIFEEISQYIRQHYSTVTIRELSDVFHFHEDYFNRLIKNRTGMTYSSYVQNLRLEMAEQLLRNSDKSIEEIADIVGYQNRGFFYKLFEKKNHMTPAEFRKDGISHNIN